MKIGNTKIIINTDYIQPDKTEEILDNISRIISTIASANLQNKQDIA